MIPIIMMSEDACHAILDVLGVMEIKLRGGGWIGRGRDKGRDNGVEEDGLNPL